MWQADLLLDANSDREPLPYSQSDSQSDTVMCPCVVSDPAHDRAHVCSQRCRGGNMGGYVS
jgi:hypothetical protein